MPRSMRSFLVGTMLVPLLGATPVQGETLSLTYQTSWKGLDLAETTLKVTLVEGRYSLNMETKTVGVANWFSDGETRVTASGRLVGQTIMAESYETSGIWDGEAYRRAVWFDSEGRLSRMEADIPEEWTEKWPRAEVPAEAQYGPDPMSHLMALVLSPLPGPEGAAYRGFDGSVVSVTNLACDPEATVAPVAESPLTGALTACQLFWSVTEGKRIETEDDKKEAAARAKRERRRGGGRGARAEAKKREVKPLEITVQQGPVLRGGLVGQMPVPVRMSLEGGLGRFVISLTSVRHETEDDLAR